jgi:hypothetical protein
MNKRWSPQSKLRSDVQGVFVIAAHGERCGPIQIRIGPRAPCWVNWSGGHKQLTWASYLRRIRDAVSSREGGSDEPNDSVSG